MIIFSFSLLAIYSFVSICHGAKNVIFFLVDDGGIDINPYDTTYVPSKFLNSPNINQIAANGVTFYNAYTSVSSCSPSRSSILTGLPIHQNGNYGLQNGIHNFGIFDNPSYHIPQVPTLTSLLNSNTNDNYYTGIIGKKNLSPTDAFTFNYSITEQNVSLYQIGRNMTFINSKIVQFIENKPQDDHKDIGIFLYIAFHDTHRCENIKDFGSFCEKFGNRNYYNSTTNKYKYGLIKDWYPQTYLNNITELPYFIPNTSVAKNDYSNYLTVYNRVDQAIGLFIQTFIKYGLLGSNSSDETLIIFSSDNGLDFPRGRTNMYEPGMQIPLILSVYDNQTCVIPPCTVNKHATTKLKLENKKNNIMNTNGSNNLVSLLDIMPTLLDWLNIDYPKQFDLNNQTIELTGQSLLPLINYSSYNYDNYDINKSTKEYKMRSNVFGSHVLHEITMYYPMRVIRNENYRLIHNLNYYSPFHIDQNFWIAPTWQQLLNNSQNGESLNWFLNNLTQYYFRPEWELYDLTNDAKEMKNLAYNQQYKSIFDQLKQNLTNWMNKTNDPWFCDETKYVCFQPWQWEHLND